MEMIRFDILAGSPLVRVLDLFFRTGRAFQAHALISLGVFASFGYHHSARLVHRCDVVGDHEPRRIAGLSLAMIQLTIPLRIHGWNSMDVLP